MNLLMLGFPGWESGDPWSVQTILLANAIGGSTKRSIGWHFPKNRGILDREPVEDL